MDNRRKLRALYSFIAGLSLVLVALGAFVRGTGAGLACPDWPLCLERIIPTLDHFLTTRGVTQEYLHRVIAALVGCCTVAAILLSYPLKREEPTLYRWSLLLLVLVVVQGIFGGLTVVLRLRPAVVTTHLALGTIFFQGAAYMALAMFSSESSRQKLPDWVPSVASLAAGLLFVQLVLGGFVASTMSGLACGRGLVCSAAFGESMPAFFITAHVLLGSGLLLAAIVMVVKARREKATFRFAYRAAHQVAGLLFVQILIGVSLVHLGMPAVLSAVHLIVAQMLLLRLVTLSAVPRVAVTRA